MTIVEHDEPELTVAHRAAQEFLGLESYVAQEVAFAPDTAGGTGTTV
ncbi:MAG: hypothetical protein HYW49_07650 [Deltaproteobacteria bacterium]|nr:hypothetical protein [Deltaproteobacteria bacterium]